MIRSKTILRLVAAVTSAVAAGAFASFAAASANAALAHAHQRAACRQQAAVHCSAHVVTYKNGRIVRISVLPSRRPVQPLANIGSTAYAPSALHTGYQLPWYASRQQTIALIVTFHHPYLKYDLDTFDTGWNLGSFPSCSASVTTGCFDQVNENGYHSGYPVNTPAGVSGTSRLDGRRDGARELPQLQDPRRRSQQHGVDRNGDCEQHRSEARSDRNLEQLRAQGVEVDGTNWSYRSAFNHPESPSPRAPGTTTTASSSLRLEHGRRRWRHESVLNSDGSYNSESVWGSSTAAGQGPVAAAARSTTATQRGHVAVDRRRTGLDRLRCPPRCRRRGRRRIVQHRGLDLHDGDVDGLGQLAARLRHEPLGADHRRCVRARRKRLEPCQVGSTDPVPAQRVLARRHERLERLLRHDHVQRGRRVRRPHGRGNPARSRRLLASETGQRGEGRRPPPASARPKAAYGVEPPLRAV